MSARDFLIASAAAGYPDSSARARLGEAHREGALPAPVAALLAIAPEDAESDYLRLFDFGVAENPLHETGYGRDRSLAVGERLADVAAFYRAFGIDGSASERLDHLAVELEFYSWLLRKEAHLAVNSDDDGVAIVSDARRKFLAEHLGPLALAVGLRPMIQENRLFGPIFGWIRDRVRSEAATLDLVVAPLGLPTRVAEPDELQCAVPAHPPGGGRLPVVAD